MHRMAPLATLRGAVRRTSSIVTIWRRLGYRGQVGLALLAGFAIRAALAITDDLITNDASAYLLSGESLWAGHGFRREGHPELHFPPLYPTVLGGLERLFGDPHTAMVVATLVASTALLVLVASLGRRLGGDRAGVAAVWVAALATGLTDVPVTYGSGNEVVFVLLVLAAVRLSILAHDRASTPRYLAALGAGGMVGCAFLTRPEGLFYLAVVAAVLVAPILVRGAQDRRSRMIALSVAVAGSAAFVVPYASYLRTNTGRWELTAKTTDASIEAWQAVADHDRRARDEVIYELADDGVSLVSGRSSLTALARDDLDGYRGIVETNTQELAKAVADPVERKGLGLGWSLLPLPLTLLAAWGAWRLRRQPSVWLLLTCMALPTATALAFFVQVRYLIPATAFGCVLTGLAVTQLRGWGARLAVGIGAALLLLSLLAAGDGSDGFLNPREPVELRTAGEWLAENTPSDARVMTRSMVVEYYAERRGVAIPYASPEEVLEFAAHHGVDYIVADSYSFRQLRPQLIDWARGHAPEGYSIVYRDQRSSRNVIVLEVDHPTSTEPPDPPGMGFMGDG